MSRIDQALELEVIVLPMAADGHLVDLLVCATIHRWENVNRGLGPRA